ncbi:PREDICTED: uncharacterized protein LOC109487613 [Branchiostoma belcheri]|uniref:Uncharacterized protein LOC109487613 n=1 Tax=Branchiostoma belcheri TaxID=7741 RepID=A0A6P5AVQ5_BRABE|nr:PREDICTED: uncharacterized protein LOC109487613 [Branchiostoma belcheri]
MSVEEAKNQPSNEPGHMIMNHHPNTTTGYDHDFPPSCSRTNLTGHYNTEDGAIRSVNEKVNPAYPPNPLAISITGTDSPSIGGERAGKDTKNSDNTVYTMEPGSAESNAIYPANNGNPDWSTSILKDKELNALYPRRVADSEESFPGKNSARTGDESQLEEGTDVGTEHITGCAIQPNLEAVYNNIAEMSVENNHYDTGFTPNAPSSTNVLDLSSSSEEAKAKCDAGTRKLPNDNQAKRYQYPLTNTTGTGERSQSDTVPTRGNTVYEIESRHDDIIDGTTLPSSNEKAIKQQNAETRKRLEVSFKQAKHALNPNTSRAGERSQFDTTNTGYESRRNNISDDDTIKPYAVVYNTEANPSESVRSNTGASHPRNPKAFSNPMYGADVLKQATDGDRSDATDVQKPPNPPDTSGLNPTYRNAHKQADGTKDKAGKITFDGKVGSDDFVLPYGLDISPGNEIFVTEQMKKQILIYNTKGIFLHSFSTGKYPWDVSADKDGNMWVMLGNRNDASLHKYCRNGLLLTQFNLPCREKTGMYTSITLDTLSDNIIVTLMRTEDPPRWAWNDHKGISIFNPGGRLVERFGRPDLTYPNSVSVDKKGNIFVVDGKNFYVYKFDMNGNYRFKFGGQGSEEGKLKTPMGSCIDGSGRLLVADNRNNRVEMFSTDTGEHIRTVVKIFQPRFLAIGKRGELVVSNDDNIVTIFTKY